MKRPPLPRPATALFLMCVLPLVARAALDTNRIEQITGLKKALDAQDAAK